MLHHEIPQPGESTLTPPEPSAPLDDRPPAIQLTHSIPVERPPFRRLRGYAFDPSLSTQLDSALINIVTMKVPWEFDPITGKDICQQGPVGEYLEVVDVDPRWHCFYAPVDLNSSYLLAEDGLAPSEGNPQFHQQMVYAVAMTTIRNFELALGREAFWAPRFVEGIDSQGGKTITEIYVQRLRIYPHALYENNSYYSPEKKALLLGYIRASSTDARYHLPGGMVFTCLAHDVVAHETTHALLDGMHPRFLEPSNIDVLAFHEAFADIVALFQHFAFPEVLLHQIAKTRGDLASENLLAKLAQESGQASGSYGALRDALGGYDANGIWRPKVPDPTAINKTFEPHARGSLLVAAIFNVFVLIYKSHIADLLRIATSGTGILPTGQLHPDLVNRLANEAAKSAKHVLNMCIRALDYCPPVDLTFGDYLRALITADYDLVRDDDLGYRLAVVEAFRGWGIYPRDVRSLSMDSLRWQEATNQGCQPLLQPMVRELSAITQEWNLTNKREEVYNTILCHRGKLQGWLDKCLREPAQDLQAVLGLDLRNNATFEVHSLRPVRRVGPDGQLLVDLLIEIMQRKAGYDDPTIQEEVDKGSMNPAPPQDFTFRGGCSLVVDLLTWKVRYCIVKRISSAKRLSDQRTFRKLYPQYAKGDLAEPFDFLHSSVK